MNKNRCWKGYKPVPGKKPYSEDSCEKVEKKAALPFNPAARAERVNKRLPGHPRGIQYQQMADALKNKGPYRRQLDRAINGPGFLRGNYFSGPIGELADRMKKGPVKTAMNKTAMDKTALFINYIDKVAAKLDPVGKEDADVNNDKKVDNSDKYLMTRRKAIGKAIANKAKKGVKAAWRGVKNNKASIAGGVIGAALANPTLIAGAAGAAAAKGAAAATAAKGAAATAAGSSAAKTGAGAALGALAGKAADKAVQKRREAKKPWWEK